MIEGMDKLKANFMQAMRRLGTRWVHRRNDREAASPPSDARTALRHPLLGALKKALVRDAGHDLTEPADGGMRVYSARRVPFAQRNFIVVRQRRHNESAFPD